MKRERELHIMSGSASALENATVIRLDGRHSIKNIKVILTEEVEEYVECIDDSFKILKPGVIYKVVKKQKFGLYVLNPDNYTEFYLLKLETKPSTKEAYEAQFKAKELTVAEIEEKLGYKIKIVK